MKFSDLFAPASSPATASPADAPLRIVRIIQIPSFNPIDNIHSEKKEGKEYIPTAAKAGIALSALSAPLVPLDQPFIDGRRYAEAGSSDVATRLDLFRLDPSGPWTRKHGVLIATASLSASAA